MLRDVARTGDTDYTAARLVTRANEDLANNIGNLVNRTVSMVRRYRDGVIPSIAAENLEAANLRAARAEAGDSINQALASFDFRRATETIIRLGDQGNRYVEAVAPWTLAKAERKDGASSQPLDAALGELVETCRVLAAQLEPFLPEAAHRIVQQCGDNGPTVAEPLPVFPRLEVSST